MTVMSLSQIARRMVLGALLAAALLYACDWLVLHVRKTPYETLTAPRILAIPQKNGRVEYQMDELNPTQSVTCVHALFPHTGAQPCWYAKRHINDPISM
jgi:hypothetical protein